MRRLLCLIVLLSAVAGLFASPAQPLEIGAKLDDFQLSDVSGTPRSLQSYSGRIVVLVFWSFKCPVSLSYNDRMEALQEKYGNAGVTVLGVAGGLNETSAEIRANISNLNIKVPMLIDPDGSLAEKLGATHTPSVFVFDRDAVLRYKGAMDNNRRPGDRGRMAYAEDAIEAILGRRPVRIPETRAFGCSIKRRTL